MKEYLVFSDAHGDSHSMEKVISSHPQIKDVLFLGDGVSALHSLYIRFPDRRFLAVKGNCDIFSVCSMGECVAQDEVIETEGHRILLTHGHTYSVKSSLMPLAKRAVEIDCDIVLFGHTHVYTERYETVLNTQISLFNPGSVGDYNGSYGILHINASNVLFSQGMI